jgi:hypothetical protein
LQNRRKNRMIAVELSGYVKKPETKKTGGGKEYVTYGLRCKTGKNQDGTPKYGYIQAKDFGNKKDGRSVTKVEDNSFVKIKGALDISEWEKDGKKNRSYEVSVFSIEVSPPKDDTGPATDKKPAAEAPDLSWMDN